MKEDTHKGLPGMSFNAPVTFNAPMFDIHDNTNVYINPVDKAVDSRHPAADNSPKDNPAKPDCQLNTPQAQAVLSRLTDAGILDESFQPLNLSNTEKGVLAGLLATKLEIRNLWQVFGTLWGMKTEVLRVAHNKAQDQAKTIRFIEKIKLVID